VPVFTNVVFDTSQVHANTIFPQMFAWLDLILEIIDRTPDTFFVIRAHPDEKRAGKISRESVSDWVKRNGVEGRPNVLFVDALEPLSSYELLQRSKFVLVYNSSIGLEGTLLGVPVICGGRARYTQYPTVFLPATAEEYRRKVEDFLEAERVAVPPVFQTNARRFLYYQFYRASLPWDGLSRLIPHRDMCN
jgi:capsule polysaccharide modification protein KpsS